MPNIVIRPFAEKDAEATAQIFFDAVRLGTTRYYDARQRKAWADRVPDTIEWTRRLQSQCVFVADIDNKPVGFMTIDAAGHIDLAFVAPDQIGKGVARALYDVIEAEAGRLGLQRLDTEASYLARTFFIRQGWTVIMEQSVVRSDVALTNFVMEKRFE